jgi:penicillin amidase
VRAAWLEPGGAPYLASLRMDQARTWDEFRNACAFSNIPGENMVWADRAGTIGWQAVGIAPIRRNWSGLVPVPGDGRYEWGGFLPIKEKPHATNPSAGFIATANNDLIPPGYPHLDAIGFEWADPFRWERISEVLDAAHAATVEDMARLQTDYHSIPARQLVPLLASVRSSHEATEAARRLLVSWDFVLDSASVPAGIYEAWFRRLNANVRRVVVPTAAQPFFRSVPATRLIEWLKTPPAEFGPNPAAVRDSLLLTSLDEAVAELARRFGGNSAGWRWGQPSYHHITITHALSAVADSATRARLDVGPASRGGDAYTPGATGGGDNQTAGASFRIVVDLSDWEKTVGINNPGQSGEPNDPHYRDLFPIWAADRYFAVPYARARVDAAADQHLLLTPRR